MSDSEPVYTETQKKVLSEFGPVMFNMHSVFLDDVIDTPEKLFRHMELMLEQEEQRRQAAEELELIASLDGSTVVNTEAQMDKAVSSVRYNQYLQECRARQEAIASARAEWRAAVTQRNEAMDAWNKYVKHKKEQFQTLRDSPVPTFNNGVVAQS